jgi:hypothetical protein
MFGELFIHDQGRWVSARTIYGQAVGDGARPREQLAEDYNLPLEAVQEAIADCESGPPEIAQDWAAKEALLEADGINEPITNTTPPRGYFRHRRWPRSTACKLYLDDDDWFGTAQRPLAQISVLIRVIRQIRGERSTLCPLSTSSHERCQTSGAISSHSSSLDRGPAPW